MAQTFDQIGAAIPFRRLLRVGLERAGLKNSRSSPHDHAMVQRPVELVIGLLVFDRIERVEIGPDRVAHPRGSPW